MHEILYGHLAHPLKGRQRSLVYEHGRQSDLVMGTRIRQKRRDTGAPQTVNVTMTSNEGKYSSGDEHTAEERAECKNNTTSLSDLFSLQID